MFFSPVTAMNETKLNLHLLRSERVRAERDHQKEALSWQERIAQAEQREKECAKEKVVLQSELLIAQQASQRDQTAVGSDQGQKYKALQRKVEELEEVHDESKRKLKAEVDRLRSQLEETRKLAAQRKDELTQQCKEVKAATRASTDLKASLSDTKAELQRVGGAHREALATSTAQASKDKIKLHELNKLLQETKAQEEKDLQARDTTIVRLEMSLEEERKRHQTTRTKLLDLQSALDANDGRATLRTNLLEKRLASTREEIVQLEADRASLQSTSVSLKEELALSRGDLEQAKWALASLTTEYGRLVESTVSKDKYKQMKMQSTRLELLVVSLRADVEDRVAQLKDLGYLVRIGAEATSSLNAVLEQTEMSREAMAQSYPEVLRDERRARTSEARQSGEFHEFQRLASELSRGVLKDRCQVLTLELDCSQSLRDYYHGQAKEIAATAEAMANAHRSALIGTQQLTQRLFQAEAVYMQLHAESKSASVAHQSSLDELQTRDEELKLVRTANAKLQTKLEQTTEEMRSDVIKAESALAAALEKATAGERLATQSRMCEEGLRADIDGLMEQLENAERYKESYLRLIKEVDVLVSRNALAEEEANKLSRVNVEILSHTNASQKIMYVDKIRRELAETKQKLIATTVERDNALTAKADLGAELATYKSLTAPVESKPKTHLIRVQRAPLTMSSRANNPLGKSINPRLKGEAGPMTLNELR
ncbi:hypothetical protein FRB93_001264 [Tulasnella sp. JGI-2019a]|nr:hypothetical protein FRB93_001264 [Tulasnella sp. JGI-2019a]